MNGEKCPCHLHLLILYFDQNVVATIQICQFANFSPAEWLCVPWLCPAESLGQTKTSLFQTSSASKTFPSDMHHKLQSHAWDNAVYHIYFFSLVESYWLISGTWLLFPIKLKSRSNIKAISGLFF